MVNEAMENVEGMKFNGVNITDLRYADDAVLVADKKKEMQKMIDRLNKTCKAYGMEINVKRTKVMTMNETQKSKGMQRWITLDCSNMQRWITLDVALFHANRLVNSDIHNPSTRSSFNFYRISTKS